MQKIYTLFLVSLWVALFLTPAIARLALHFNLVDRPLARKIHTIPTPRIGGVAIYFAVLASLIGSLFWHNDVVGTILAEKSIVWVFMGATTVFMMGLADDIVGLSPGTKLAVQSAAAFMAYFGGARIVEFQLPWISTTPLGVFSMPLTVFWFLLVINAINLIDGLDGLAAGISLFVSLFLLISCIMSGNFTVATELAALSGACLGFLRYNFNPASIFMGDSGSYFLGYLLAALSILGSIKSQATAAILVPVIALGFPIMDALISPLRRFVIGKGLFRPDKNHIHHKLLKMGLSHRNAVLLLYGATISLGAFSLLLVHAQEEKAAFVLLATGVALCIAIHKLGYLEYFAVDKVWGYIQDITDVIGLQKDRRTFRSNQIEIEEAADTDELWDKLKEALLFLRIDQAEIMFDEGANNGCICLLNNIEQEGEKSRKVLCIDLPLAENQTSYGTLRIKKDLASDPINNCTLRRIELLRRSLVSRLKNFEKTAKVADRTPVFEY